MGRRTGGLLEEMKNLLLLPGIKPRFFGLAHFLMTTPTTISHPSLEVLFKSFARRKYTLLDL